LDPQAPGLLASDDFAQAMSLKTRQSVLDRLARNLIVGWKAGNGSYRLPLERLRAADLNAVMKAAQADAQGDFL